jgi:hypothetical protein
LFIGAMKHYVAKWKFAHPYPEDFRQAVIEYTHADLNWFFDQWLETTKYIDYKIKSVDKIKTDSSENAWNLTFQRLGRMQMPLKFSIVFEDGSSKKYIIPNTWFKQPGKDSILKKWYGWDLLQPTYTTIIKSSSKLKSVIIDPDMYLADIDNSNNEWGKKKTNTTWEFDHRVPRNPNWKYRRNYLRPDIWYNGFDGIQIGAHAEGLYFNKYQYHISAWGNTTLGQNLEKYTSLTPQRIAFAADYTRHLSRISREMIANGQLSCNAGIWKGQIGIDKIFRRQDQRVFPYTKISLYAKYLVNETNYTEYLLYPTEWGIRNQNKQWVNASMNMSILRNYKYQKGTGTIQLVVRAPFIASSYNYSQVTLEAKNQYAPTKKIDVRSRIFGQLGLNQVPLESSLYAAGANQEQMIDNKYTRANGIVPDNWLGYGSQTNHFQYGGGLNLRGFAGLNCLQQIQTSSGTQYVNGYQGKSGASWNLEIDFDKYIPIKAKGLTKNLHFDTYLFYDAGILNFSSNNKNYWGFPQMDAGAGTCMTIKFTPYDVTPLIIRADFPFFVNMPEGGGNYTAFRYLLSLNRAF